MKYQTMVSCILGKHHTVRLSRHITAITFTVKHLVQINCGLMNTFQRTQILETLNYTVEKRNFFPFDF